MPLSDSFTRSVDWVRLSAWFFSLESDNIPSFDDIDAIDTEESALYNVNIIMLFYNYETVIFQERIGTYYESI